MFVGVPLLFLGISAMFEQDTTGMNVLGSFIVIFMAAIIAYTAFWCFYRDGRAKCVECMTNRERKRVTIRDLPDDMDYLKLKMAALIDHTGLPEDEEDKEAHAEEEDVKEEV